MRHFEWTVVERTPLRTQRHRSVLAVHRSVNYSFEAPVAHFDVLAGLIIAVQRIAHHVWLVLVTLGAFLDGPEFHTTRTTPVRLHVAILAQMVRQQLGQRDRGPEDDVLGRQIYENGCLLSTSDLQKEVSTRLMPGDSLTLPSMNTKARRLDISYNCNTCNWQRGEPQ